MLGGENLYNRYTFYAALWQFDCDYEHADSPFRELQF